MKSTVIVKARNHLMASSVLIAAMGATQAHAQAQPAADNGPKLEEIVVTAQKREQNMQDVPIAVTALSQNTLQVNRVVSVDDLTGLAPGVQVRSAAGGTQLASFTIRGAVSYGVVPGSDKEVSIYLDGAYLSSPRGSIFELPDVSDIEILRGPQGTLFGRNATAGAVSITTRDPTGKFDVRQDTTLGNLNQFRSRTSIDLPQVGAFSAYASFVHDYVRGDIRNASAGVVWNRTAEGLGIQVSPAYLGTKDANTVFAALKFAPGDRFSTVYKFNHGTDHGSPEGDGIIAYNPAGAAGAALTYLFANQPSPVNFAPDGLRPDVANNGFETNLNQSNTGHNLTSKFLVSDNVSLKNVFAYHESYIFSNSPSDGFG